MKKLKDNLYAPNETVQNYNEGNFENLEPGVYHCVICQVKDDDQKEYLYIEFDIAEGPHKGYYERLSDRAGFWGGKIFLSYKDKAISIFKRALKAINATNLGYVFNPFSDGKNADEKTLIGKTFWVVLHEEEYEKSDGTTGSRMTASATAFLNESQAKEGKFNKKLLDKVAARKSTATSPSSTDVPDFLDSSSVDNPFA
ncbi:MAG: hypothetical protein IIY23_05020 [Erysipelotrichaceae bacterium]|nr:hypothetical protein [Erysipelotrichaceae bacterium]